MSASEEDIVVEVRFEIEKDSEGFPKSRDAELLRCKPSNPECSTCVVVSVPLYLRNVAYGDTISTVDSPSGSLEFGKVLNRGGYSVYRILLHDPSKKNALIDKLLNFGVLLERDDNLIAIAAPPNADVDAIVDYLLEGKQEGFWGLQDGYIHEVS